MTGEDKAHARRAGKAVPYTGRPAAEVRRLLRVRVIRNDPNKGRVPLHNLTPVDHG